MRAAVVLFAFTAACTPDIVSGAYLCGPNASCPEGQECNGPDNTCVLASTGAPFECTPDHQTEPDDTSAQAYEITGLGCVSIPFVSSSCMLEGDSEDWVKFTAPSGCTAVELLARVSFTLAFERLGLELWNLDTNMLVTSDTECPTSGEAGDELRCMTQTLDSGVTYGLKVHPAGDGNCGGACSYNRYTLRIQLDTP